VFAYLHVYSELIPSCELILTSIQFEKYCEGGYPFLMLVQFPGYALW